MKAYHAVRNLKAYAGLDKDIDVYVVVHGKDYVPFAKYWESEPENDPILNQDRYVLHSIRQGGFARVPDAMKASYTLGEFIWEASDED